MVEACLPTTVRVVDDGLMSLTALLIASSVVAAAPELVIQSGQTFAKAMSVSADGRFAATSAFDGSLAIWDLDSGFLLRTIAAHDKSVFDVAYSPDGARIASVSDDRTVRVWEARTGKELMRAKTDGTPASVAFSADGRTVMVHMEQIASKSPTGKARHLLGVWAASDGKSICNVEVGQRLLNSGSFAMSRTGAFVLGADSGEIFVGSGSGCNVTQHNRLPGDVQHVAVSDDGKVFAAIDDTKKVYLWHADGSNRHDFAMAAHINPAIALSADGSLLLVGGNSSTLELWSTSTRERLQVLGEKVEGGAQVIDLAFRADGSSVSLSHTGELTLRAAGSGELLRHFGGLVSAVVDIAFAPDGRTLFGIGQDGRVRGWDLEQARVAWAFDKGGERNDSQERQVAVTADGKHLLARDRDDAVLVRIADYTVIRRLPRTLTIGLSQDTLYTLDSQGGSVAVNARDLMTGDVRWKVLSRPLYDLALSPTGDRVAISGINGHRVWDTATQKEVGSSSEVVTALALSVNLTATGYVDGSIRYGGRTLQAGGHVTGLTFSPDGRALASTTVNSVVEVWDIESGTRRHRLAPHSAWRTAFSPDNKRLATAARDGAIRIFDVATGELLVLLVGIGAEDGVAMTPEGYYSSTRGAYYGVAFRSGDVVYPFEQFDLRFNRPDLVLERLGLADATLIAAYRRAYDKRLKRMGFTEADLSDALALPTVAFVDRPPPRTRDKQLTFKVRAGDTKEPLRQIDVLVNGVPLYGRRGLPVQSDANVGVEKSLTIELSNGNNRVQVSALNARGIKSLVATFDIAYDGPPAPSTLHVFTIGVSKYKDASMALAYAAKDARDVAALFKNESGQHARVEVTQLLDKQAVKTAIIGLKKALQKTQPDDTVLLFLAGHGLIDEATRYYFATYDTNFANPAAKAIGYDAIEDLLDGIPARNKVLLMDTCHSGEVDDDLAPPPAVAALGGTIKSRGIKASRKVASSGVGAKSAELLSEAFNDLRHGTGAAVIASAGGVEFALESPEWNNGVFTYALLHGLRSREADTNANGQVTVSEVRDYVTKRVKELTGGRQTPTARRENLLVDFLLR